ncbi:MAG: 30S ribosomal protein S5 [Candidatus Saccharibacteria bacterium]|nr:30S ribosomal protein S5 [Candidatus Saccharibacteria bacterium]
MIQKQQTRRQSGQPQVEEKQFDERVVHIDRVARVVKGGRRFRFRALVVIGDHKAQIGIGVSKGADVTTAVTKAVDVAKKNLVKIAIYNNTIPHEAEAKVSGAHILVKPAAPGTGLIAGGVVRIVLEVAGISNALSKSLGSANKINIAYATLKALQSIEPAENWHTTRYKQEQKADKSSTKSKTVKTKSTAATKESKDEV